MCTCTVFGIDSLCDVPIVREPVCLDAHTIRVRVECSALAAWAMHLLYVGAWTWTCTLYFYLNSVRHGQHGRCNEDVSACTCTCKVFGMKT